MLSPSTPPGRPSHLYFRLQLVHLFLEALVTEDDGIYLLLHLVAHDGAGLLVLLLGLSECI